jgi:hypothetical protein
MKKSAVLAGVSLVFLSFLFLPQVSSFLTVMGPAQLSPRVQDALMRGERELQCIVWFSWTPGPMAVAGENKLMAMAMRVSDTTGGKVLMLMPLFGASVMKIPAENIQRALSVSGVRFVDLDIPLRVSEIELAQMSVGEIAQSLSLSSMPGDGTGVDVFVLDTGAPKDVEISSVLSAEEGSPYDEHGHGSAVIGIIKSLAPGARIHSVKVLGPFGSGMTSTVLKGLEIVLQSPGEKKVVNVSLGAPDAPFCSLKEAFTMAVKFYGVDVVAASGNDPSAPELSPASSPVVVGVGAVGPDNRLTSYSCRSFDVVSYGDQIGVCGPYRGLTIRGTSFASPVVTALLARYYSQVPYKPSEVDAVATLKKGSVLTPEGYPMPTAASLSSTPPVPEGRGLPVLFISFLLSGLGVVLVGVAAKE